MEIIALILSAIVVYALWRFGRWSDRAFDEIKEGRERAMKKEEQRDRAIEKLGSWLDRH